MSIQLLTNASSSKSRLEASNQRERSSISEISKSSPVFSSKVISIFSSESLNIQNSLLCGNTPSLLSSLSVFIKVIPFVFGTIKLSSKLKSNIEEKFVSVRVTVARLSEIFASK